MKIITLCILLVLTSCVSSPEKRAPKQPKKVAEETAPITNDSPKPSTVKPIRGTLADLLKYHESHIERVGTKGVRGDYDLSPEDVKQLKRNIASTIQWDSDEMRFLTQKESGSGWFGNSVAIANSLTSEILIADRNGKKIVKPLKDRIFGGTFVDETGQSALITAFYGEMREGALDSIYEVYWGAEKAEVLNFKLDREARGSITAKIKSPAGKPYTIIREGRNNGAIIMDGQRLRPLFE